MDVVVRTPHGEAEVSIRMLDLDVATLLEQVTGRPAPAIVAIDRRPVSSSTPLGDCGLLVGSVIATTDEPDGGDHVVRVVQVAGVGSGSTRALSPGRYAVGPGRRVVAGELDLAPVETPVFDVQVSARGEVTVAAASTGAVLRFDGDANSLGGERVVWTDEYLDVGGRVFALRPPVIPRRPAGTAADGTVPFERAPIDPHAHGSADLARAIDTAQTAGPALWSRRPDHPDAYVVPVGFTHRAPVSVDLRAERGIGVIGSSEFTTALTRALLVQAAVDHGPADLEVVVVAPPDQADEWDWVRWLPHARVGGPARVLTTDAAAERWAETVLPVAVAGAEPGPIVLVVVADAAHLRGRGPAMRELVAARSALLRFVVLDASASGLPAMCTISVVEQPSGSARIDPPGHPRQPTDLVDDIRPVLVSADLARCVARLLAPLDDLELPTLRAANLPMSVPLPVLLGLDDAGADVVAARWERARGPLATIGVSAHGPVTIDLAADGPNVVIAGEAGVVEALDAVLVAVAANSPPDRVNILLVGTAMVTTAAAALPHTIGVIDDFGDRRGDRLLRWLRTEVRHRTQPGAAAARLVVAVAELGAPAAAGWRRTLLELAATGAAAGVHVVWATERCDVDTDLLAACATRIALQMRRPEDSRALVGTVDAVRLPGIPGRAIVRRGADPTVVQLASLESAGVVPARHARRPWPMEHRLGRAVDERGGQRIGESIGRAARLGDRHPSAGYLAELPLELELHSFLASHPGDGVPIGLADLPDEHRHEPEWWVPGPEGGLLVYGCTPAWSASLVSVLCLGVAARCASDDVGLHVVTADAAPLAALRGLAHVAAVVDDPDQVAEVIAGLAATVEHRHRVGHRRHEPAAVLIIDRFGAVRQRVERRPNATSVLAGLDLVLRDGPVVGVCVVVTAEDERVVPADVVAALHDRFVTGLIAAHDPPAFGSTGADGPVAGRAIRLRDMVEVQFVAAPDDLRLAVEEFGVDVGSVS